MLSAQRNMPRKRGNKVSNPEGFEGMQRMQGLQGMLVEAPKVFINPLVGRSNWTGWKRKMIAQFHLLGIAEAIDEELEVNDRRNVVAVWELLSKIEYKLISQLPVTSSAFEIWKTLESMFDIQTSDKPGTRSSSGIQKKEFETQEYAKVLELLSDILRVEIDNLENFEQKLTRLREIYSEINAIEQVWSEDMFILLIFALVGDKLKYPQNAVNSNVKLTMSNVFPRLVSEVNNLKQSNESEQLALENAKVVCSKCSGKGRFAQSC